MRKRVDSKRNTAIVLAFFVLFLIVINFLDTGVLLQPSGFNYIQLDWTDNADNEVGFFVERSTDSGFSTIDVVCNVGSSSPVSATNVQLGCQDDGTIASFSAGTTYYYRVASYNNLGPGGSTLQSSYSNTASVTTPSGQVTPVITALNPSTVFNNEPVTVVIEGNGFIDGLSIVKINGVVYNNVVFNQATGFLEVSFSPSTFTGSLTVTVENPYTSGNLVSNSVTLNVIEPTPFITTVTPNPVPINELFTLTINGDGFSPNSVIELTNVDPATNPTWESVTPSSQTVTQLSATINPSGLLNTDDTLYIRVVNGGGPISNIVSVSATASCSSTAPPCLSQGVCTGITATCNGATGLWECTYPPTYGPEICDGLDNDCNGIDDDNLQAPLCDNQAGVCGGSFQTCGGTSGWLACGATEYSASATTYTSPLTGLPGVYQEGTETVCDLLDNNCNTEIDEGSICIPGAPGSFTATIA